MHGTKRATYCNGIVLREIVRSDVMKRQYKLFLLLSAGLVVLLKSFVLDQYFLLLLRSRSCPDKHTITVIDAGQLGNNIWEYMSLFAMTHLHQQKLKLVAYCPETLKAKLEEVFENDRYLRHSDNVPLHSLMAAPLTDHKRPFTADVFQTQDRDFRHTDSRLVYRLDYSDIQQKQDEIKRLSIPGDSKMPSYCLSMKNAYTIQLNETFDFHTLIDNTHPFILAKWSARYKEVLQYGIPKIKRELRFKETYVKHTRRKFEEIKALFDMHHKRVTYVGMHYRGTDYIDLLKNNYDFTGPTNYKFYLKAMNYFKRKYKNVIFILITIDFVWLKENLPFLIANNNLVVNPNQQDHIEDLTLLSHCNHSIINYGTFGATSALFAGGTTFVYDLGIPLDQRGPTIAMGLAKSLPKWHILKGST